MSHFAPLFFATRKTTFFPCQDHERLLDACLEDLFVEFDGVRQVLHGNGAASLPPSPAPTPTPAPAPSAPTHAPPTAGQAMPPHQFPHVAPTHTAGMTAPSAAMHQPVHAIQRTPQLEQLVAMGFSPEQSDTALHAGRRRRCHRTAVGPDLESFARTR